MLPPSQWLLLILSIAPMFTKEPELPLCPTNIQFFPQKLPMHCRMPAGSIVASGPSMPQANGVGSPSAPFYRQHEQPGHALPLMVPPGLPGLPASLPGSFGAPAPMPLMSMPMPAPVPSHKLPVIVMPFYSPDPAYKKSTLPKPKPKYKGSNKKRKAHKKPRYDSSSDTDTSDDTDSSSETSDDVSTNEEWRRKENSRNRHGGKNHRNRKTKKVKEKKNKKKELLTPLLQYVTKDGYVIYEKKITKGEAHDWLAVRNEEHNKGDEGDKRVKLLKRDEPDDFKINAKRVSNRSEEEENVNAQKSHFNKKRAHAVNADLDMFPAQQGTQ